MSHFAPTSIDIQFDPEGFEITIMLEGLRLTAEKRPNGSIAYSENFEDIEDDVMYNALTNLCKNLLQQE